MEPAAAAIRTGAPKPAARSMAVRPPERCSKETRRSESGPRLPWPSSKRRIAGTWSMVEA